MKYISTIALSILLFFSFTKVSAQKEDTLTPAQRTAVLYLDTAKLLRSQNNLKVAFRYIQKSAVLNNAEALVYLANAYQFGEGVDTNIAEAVKCYKQAAALENPIGLYYLCLLYTSRCV